MKRDCEPDSGTHPFLEILEALISQPPEAGSDNISRRSDVPLWEAGADRAGRKGTAASRASAYHDYADTQDRMGRCPDTVRQQAKPRMEDIRKELGLRADFTIADLGRARKSFAALNHPDRIGGPLRQLAEQRMKIANAIIDMEIARRRKASGAAPAFRT